MLQDIEQFVCIYTCTQGIGRNRPIAPRAVKSG
jgi:hypothetical protein